MNIFKISLFAMGVVLSSSAFAATGSGHAQAELDNPLSVSITEINFGTIAIDPGAGAQTVTVPVVPPPFIICPATYVCTGSPTAASATVTGSPNSAVDLSIVGQTATLDDGSGNTLTFDPFFISQIDTVTGVSLDGAGSFVAPVGGSIDFDGTEVAGTYTSQNGSGYVITVNY